MTPATVASPPLAWTRLALAAALGFAAILAAYTQLIVWTEARFLIDSDRQGYVLAWSRFLETGSPYLASDVAAPYEFRETLVPQTYLHPPLALLLVAPFAYLPPILWYAVPLGILAALVVAWRPSLAGWAVIALLLAWPYSGRALILGNTDLWAAAFVAAGLRWGWPAALLIVKPSMLPFALVGVRRRSWWLAAGLLALLALPLGSLWAEWLAVMANSPGDVLYSLPNYALLLVPVVAYLGRAGPSSTMSGASVTVTSSVPD